MRLAVTAASWFGLVACSKPVFCADCGTSIIVTAMAITTLDENAPEEAARLA